MTERKVWVAATAAAVAGGCVGALAWVLPTWMLVLVGLLGPGLAAFLAGRQARHTPRPDLYAYYRPGGLTGPTRWQPRAEPLLPSPEFDALRDRGGRFTWNR